jgi:hypothetical protein
MTDFVNLDQVRYLTILNDSGTGRWGVYAVFSHPVDGFMPIFSSETRIEAEQYAEHILGQPSILKENKQVISNEQLDSER